MRRGIGEEDKIHIGFGQIVAKYEHFKALNCLTWSYQAGGEKRNIQTGAMLKKKGLKRGTPDYSFIKSVDGQCHFIWIEFKTKSGKQSEEQKEFEEMCSKTNNMRYYIARSIEEGINILTKENILQTL